MGKIDVITIQHPNEFKGGTRIMIRTNRSKENGGKGEDVLEKVVTRSVDEFFDTFNAMSSRRSGQERIYSTVDERDVKKAIRIFKERQLDADYYDEESKESFYIDIHNRWISALQNPSAAKTSLFMVDVDEGDDLEKIYQEISHNSLEILHEYDTKNGKHIILKPFNPKIVTFKIMQNGMMLLAYNAYKTTKLK